ncbi:tRNA pseudouridine(55) synthase TruB [Bifidobacterium sp. 64T4]|uniref:tRNA pseudouridine(55) synthase TruB n=1 Tax=Bifidobacterium pongonis TaxID=2834432 RepID=UPI001C5A2639|nr:tRNA pseudouridine(55) synthase TruB [Bifidobacterium pongonis]MBW3094975.1 tRNA pseudouridine(55) synthase TruB [Bifidobacterium pongonis]
MTTKTGTMRKPEPSGLLLVDKPQGVTSFDVVAAARGALHIKKVGHAGTLDPMATGLLVLAFGRATRLLSAIVEHDKTYEATIRLGLCSTTDDAEGDVCRFDGSAQAAILPPADPVQAVQAVESAVRTRFLGDIDQVPNTFSSIKINGKRAYDLAREGKDVELKARKVTIGEFAVLDARQGYAGLEDAACQLCATPDEGHAEPVMDVDVRVSCSSGTYIRALARDLGAELGIGGYLTRLRRTCVGRFALPDDASGLADPQANTARIITAHAEAKTFTNREGETITRNRAVLDTPFERGDERTDWVLGHALGMLDAAKGAMPVIAIDANEAAELRFGRRIARAVTCDTVAYVPAAGDGAEADVVAIIGRANAHMAKPLTVFPAD